VALSVPQPEPAGESAPAGDYLEVVFDVPLKTSFSYRRDEAGLADIGRRVLAPFGRREAAGFVVGRSASPPDGFDPAAVKAIRRTVDKEELFGKAEIELARWLAGYYLCGPGEALAAMLPSARREAAPADFPVDDLAGAVAAHVLSSEQEKALAAVFAKDGADGAPPSAGKPHYLYGITGSGKTEVFLAAAERVLAAGRSAIYLVPEIALSRQVAEAIGARFGTVAATLHSKMTAAERLREWTRLRRGEARIVVGPRSAVFAPVKDLGLIVIDEEHDGSYKSGAAPRYHARQVAMKRCALSGARLLMGSATPSVEAWKAMADGSIVRHDLTRRLSGGAMPEIRAVSLENSEGCLGPELREEIRACHRAGRQTILFLNRRGFAYFYRCRSCGYELRCKHCSVALTYHKSRGRAVCHYCGFQAPPPAACPQCASLDAGFVGSGTEMIEEEVARTFPELKAARADADTAQRKGSLEATLADFKAGRIDLLLGTQMVAKGLNFPGVRLVGVVLADTGLNMPDFRAAERTFALIVQVAGRAGRYFPDGRVIVQSFRPEEPAIRLACAMDVAGFYAAELAARAELGFPPYSRLIRFVARAKEGPKADAAIRRLVGLLADGLPPGAEILGPAECPIGAIAGSFRRHALLRGADFAAAHRHAAAVLDAYGRTKDASVHLEVDVDPVALL
jgi:primosomal protein N' (replication factor Y)